jgi:hypothetical protein
MMVAVGFNPRTTVTPSRSARRVATIENRSSLRDWEQYGRTAPRSARIEKNTLRAEKHTAVSARRTRIDGGRIYSKVDSMTHITVSDRIKAQLGSSREPLVLCDEAGNPLGTHPAELN